MINSLIKDSLSTNISSEINTSLELIFTKTTKLASENKKLWQIREDVNSLKGFNHLIENIPSEGGESIVSESIQVLKWLINKVQYGDFHNSENIYSILFLINLIDSKHEFWKVLNANNITPKSALINFSLAAVKSANTQIKYSYLSDFYRREASDRIDSIVTQQDWYKIYEEFHRSAEGFKYELHFSLVQSAYITMEFRPKSLYSILESHYDIPFLWGLLDILGKESSLKIAKNTDSNILEFCALAASLPFPSQVKMNDVEKAILSEVFLKLSKKQSKFSHWMKILNTYPSRYPDIQTSLGKALARSEDLDVFTKYIDAIDLYPLDVNDEGRNSVAACLSSFTKNANDTFRLNAWHIAFNKWDDWDFNTNKENGYLFEIKASILDYAVTQYYLECMTPEKRKQSIEVLYSKLSNINNEWHQSSSKFTTFWYLCLSKLQPLFHIEQISTDSTLPILMKGRTYTPIENEYSKYLKMIIN